MDILRTNKTIAGNIALVLVLALFCSVAFGAVGTDVAEAGTPPDPTVEVDGVTATTGSDPNVTVTIPHGATEEITIEIFPVTDASFDPIFQNVYFEIGGVASRVYLIEAGTISEGVYVDQIVYGVYGGVYGTFSVNRTAHHSLHHRQYPKECVSRIGGTTA